MSLDVYLKADKPQIKTGSGIFVRRDGQTIEISREEWDKLNTGFEPVALRKSEPTTEVYHDNITHNLGGMAAAAGIYKHLWRPDEIGITIAAELVSPLANGLALLKANHDKFRQHNPENGWGNYEGLVRFVESYLQACKRYPESTVDVWR